MGDDTAAVSQEVQQGSSLMERRGSRMMSDSASGRVSEEKKKKKRLKHFVKSNKAKEIENDPKESFALRIRIII